MTGRPQVWIFCGPNGAGKSTLAERFLRGRLPIINPDVIAQGLPRRVDGSLAEMEAGRIALQERREHLAAGVSFAFETTLSGNTELATLRAARDCGFKVNLLFVGVEDAKQSAVRVGDRVRRGGHDVPIDALTRRYERTMCNFASAAVCSDRVIVFDNSGFGHRLLFVQENGETRHHAAFPDWARKWLPAEYQVKEQGT